MGRKLPADQVGVFPGHPNFDRRHGERDRVLKRMLAVRAGLPRPEQSPYGNLGNRTLNAYVKKLEMQAAVRDNVISAHEGETGSGKSTQLPQFALEMGYRVVMLEPRRITANSLGERLKEELVSQLGDDAVSLVGIRHGERRENPGAMVQVMTPGTFMRVMDELEEYSDEPLLIISDEIHEKDFETEMATAVAAMTLAKHPKWRLALMSATMDSEVVDSRMSRFSNGYIPHIEIEGRPHELETHEEEELGPVAAYKKYGAGHERSVLFTAGKAEIRDYIREFRALGDENLVILPLHSKLTDKEIDRAIKAELKPGQRLLIISTPVAQSGLTIEGLTLVMVDGTVRRSHLDADGVQGLLKMYGAQDEFIQMAGRAGRDVGGGVAVLVKSLDPRFGYKAFEDREEQAPAQIYSTNIARNTLLAISLGYDFFKVNDYLIHGVDRSRILDALEVLWRLQAIDEHNQITEIGKAMNEFPVRPELARSLVYAQQHGASGDNLRQLAAIVAATEAGELPFYDASGTVSELWRKDIPAEAKDDPMASLGMFRATRKFYKGDYVNEAALLQRGYDTKSVLQAHQTYDKICQTFGLDARRDKIPVASSADAELLEDYLTAGLFDFTHRKSHDEKLRGKGSGTRTWYRETHRTETGERRISDRSRMQVKGPDLVIGLPRSYEKPTNGEVQIHNVLERVMSTSVSKLAKHVMHLVTRRQDQPPKLVDGVLKQTTGLFFGDIRVGEEVEAPAGIVHTAATKRVLMEGIFNKPTQTISELVQIKDTLEYLQRRVPVRTRHVMFPNGIMTQDWLMQQIDEATDGEVTNIYTLDNRLRAMVVREKISMRTWISEEHEATIRRSSPDTITLANGVQYPIYWTNGRAVINGFNLQDVDVLPATGFFLPDGREVLFSHKNDNDDTKRLKAGALKEAVASNSVQHV